MSLKSPRLLAPFSVIGLAALIVSCGQQSNSPTGPSSIGSTPGFGQQVVEYIDMLADPGTGTSRGLDEEPAPAPLPPPPPPPGSGPTPWPPGPPPLAMPGVPMPTPPNTHFRVSVRVDPNPVPYSGVPVALFSCRDNRHTWYYDQLLSTDTGIGVTLTERENFFDGRFVSRNPTTIRIEGNNGAKLQTRWCSAFTGPHYAQTRFKGKDDNGEVITLSGPWVPMLTPK